jgi:hypothetical protein
MISLCQRDWSFTQRWKIHVFWDVMLCRGYVSGVSKDRTACIFVAAQSKKKYFFSNCLGCLGLVMKALRSF